MESATSLDGVTGRKRAMSHNDYLNSLLRPSGDEVARITGVQLQHERDICAKYHNPSGEVEGAATTIQKAYRGYRDRRQLEGLTLDPSARWLETIKELRYRTATSSRYSNVSGPESESSRFDQARTKWKRAGVIAEHAASDGSPPRRFMSSTGSNSSAVSHVKGSMLLDQRYFLEMVDQRHRYGTNLQVYHEEWLRSDSNVNFFEWLDHGPGRQLDLVGCSREKLDRERIRYLSREERQDYLVDIDHAGKLRWHKNGELISTDGNIYRDSIHGIVAKDAADPMYAETNGTIDHIEDSDVSLSESEPEKHHAHQQVTKDRTPQHRRFRVSPATVLNHILRASVKPGTWIYVADTVGRLYVGIKSSGAFQHASFLAGGRISSAGLIGIENGQLVYLSPLSGHYRPTTKSFKTFIQSLKSDGADLSHLKVSHAYGVLLGMEYYDKAAKGISKVLHHKKAD